MKNGIDPGILKSKEDLDPNVGLKEAGYPTVRVFRTESGKQAFYTNMYRSSIYDEPEVIATFKRLVTGAPQIGFVQGHRERRLDSKEPLEDQTVLNGKRDCFGPIRSGGYFHRDVGGSTGGDSGGT